MMNTFDALISRLNMVKERISELQHIATESSKSKKQRRTKTETRETKRVQKVPVQKNSSMFNKNW